VNRTSVLACIQRHLRYFRGAKGDDGCLRPLGELIPPIAAELRAGIDTSNIQVSVTAVPLVAAFIDGVVSPQEEFAVCQAILVDNSVLAELVAGVLALEEVHPNSASLPRFQTIWLRGYLKLPPKLFPPLQLNRLTEQNKSLGQSMWRSKHRR
jgi:hypothetical protein